MAARSTSAPMAGSTSRPAKTPTGATRKPSTISSGKILRLNVDGSAPADNPFNDADAIPNEPRDYIWALGLRNPFTTAFDPVTGRFHINDVGEVTWEEVNLGVAGRELWLADVRGRGERSEFRHAAHLHLQPLYGGQRRRQRDFRRRVLPPCRQRISQFLHRRLLLRRSRARLDCAVTTSQLALPRSLRPAANFPVDLKTGDDGALYYLERGSGSVRRIRNNTPAALPSWLAPSSSATWNGTTLTVTGDATIIDNPGADAPFIVGTTAAANLTINPPAGTPVEVNGISLSTGATMTIFNATTPNVRCRQGSKLQRDRNQRDRPDRQQA